MYWLLRIINLFKKVKPVYPATMTKSEVVTQLEIDILIHENWAAIVTGQPEYADSFGDYDWHLFWIEVYQNAIHYIRGID